MRSSADSELELSEPTSDGGAQDQDPTNLHLWKLPRGRHGLPRELVARSQRERLLAAVVRVAAAKGYQASSVADILKEAGVGRETFYRHFNDKEDCFIAAHDALLDSLTGEIVASYEQPGTWPERVRGALAAALEWFAVNPVIARVMLIETGNIGPQAPERFHEVFHRFIGMLDEGGEFTDPAPLPNIASIAGAAGFVRIYEEVALGRSDRLQEQLPLLTFELLLPYIGEEAAAAERQAAEETLAERAGGQ